MLRLVRLLGHRQSIKRTGQSAEPREAPGSAIRRLPAAFTITGATSMRLIALALACLLPLASLPATASDAAEKNERTLERAGYEIKRGEKTPEVPDQEISPVGQDSIVPVQ